MYRKPCRSETDGVLVRCRIFVAFVALTLLTVALAARAHSAPIAPTVWGSAEATATRIGGSDRRPLATLLRRDRRILDFPWIRHRRRPIGDALRVAGLSPCPLRIHHSDVFDRAVRLPV
jgi:hypothetical protein